MNKQDNKLALSVLATLTSAIALIYTLIMYHHIIFAVIGMSILFLICAYQLTKKLVASSAQKNLSLNMQLRDCINDISSQLEAMNGAQSQIGKATFLYTRQAAQTVSVLESNYVQSQEALFKNLVSLLNAQNKATKLMIKFDHSNTTKVISTIKELRNQLSDTMIQGFDQLHPNNDEVVAALADIVNYLKSQPAITDPNLSIQLQEVAHELQNISNNIQHTQTIIPNSVPPMVNEPFTGTMTDTITPSKNVSTEERMTIQDELPLEETALTEEMIPEMPEPIQEVSDISEIADVLPDEPAITETTDVLPDEPAITETTDTLQDQPAITETMDALPDDLTLSDDTDSLLDDAIAPETANALQDEPAIPDTTDSLLDESITEEIADILPDTSNITESATSSETLSVPEKGANEMLSADEIAALFASAEPAPKKSTKTESADEKPQTTKQEATAEDSNKQLSADEIAALFAAAEPVPKKKEPVSEDPNKQLSPEEIAALFASM